MNKRRILRQSPLKKIKTKIFLRGLSSSDHRRYIRPMKKLILILTVVPSLTINLFADEAANLPAAQDLVFANIREGRSSLMSSQKEDQVRNEYQGNPDLKVLKSIVADRSINRCATKVIRKIKNELGLTNQSDVELAVLGLRLYDSLDDVSANILLKANDLSNAVAAPITKDDLSSDEEEQAMDIYKSKADDFKNRTLCMEDTYRELVGKLYSKAPKFLDNLKHINKMARNEGYITDDDFKTLEVFRIKKVHEWPVTLGSYAQSLEQLSKRFNTRVKESSNLITQTKFRQKYSMRMSLYQKYNSTQIIMLANIVKGLKTRLESKDVTITINYVDRPAEVIELSPMEKFRFILKLLRKEMADLNNSSLLDGKSATYLELITAAYEVGYISANEIEQLASLQDIWNPQKTPKEKAMFWVKTFGGVASVLLPPPFGFVSVMAIMLIDQQIKEAPVDRDPDFNLF